MIKIANIIKIILLYYLIIIGIVYISQRWIIYHPDKSTATPLDYASHDYEAFEIIAKDGIKLKSWFHAPKDKNAPVIIFFHGNADLAARFGTKFIPFFNKGYGVLLVELRGFGSNKGKISETLLIDDANMLLQQLNKDGYNSKNIIVYGHSLGTGIATALASNNKTKALILESPFYSLLSRAKETYWFLPVKYMLKDTFRNDLRIKNVSSPIIIIHGNADKIISVEHSKKLAKKAKNAELHIIDRGKHMDLHNKGANRIILNWLSTL